MARFKSIDCENKLQSRSQNDSGPQLPLFHFYSVMIGNRDYRNATEAGKVLDQFVVIDCEIMSNCQALLLVGKRIFVTTETKRKVR